MDVNTSFAKEHNERQTINKAELPRTLLHVKPLVIELDVDRDRARASPLQRRRQHS